VFEAREEQMPEALAATARRLRHAVMMGLGEALIRMMSLSSD